MKSAFLRRLLCCRLKCFEKDGGSSSVPTGIVREFVSNDTVNDDTEDVGFPIPVTPRSGERGFCCCSEVALYFRRLAIRASSSLIAS